MQMDTYIYAPKDDCKHRMFWREMYSVEEAGKQLAFDAFMDKLCFHLFRWFCYGHF